MNVCVCVRACVFVFVRVCVCVSERDDQACKQGSNLEWVDNDDSFISWKMNHWGKITILQASWKLMEKPTKSFLQKSGENNDDLWFPLDYGILRGKTHSSVELLLT